MNLFTAGVIMVIVPVIVKILNGYFVNFVPGYYELPDWMIEIAEKSNPLLCTVVQAGGNGLQAVRNLSADRYMYFYTGKDRI